MTQTMTGDSEIAFISRTVPMIVDRITGGREAYPLFLSSMLIEAFRKLNLHAQVMYGRAAWIEITSDHRPRWTGSWHQFHFWVQTKHQETVDFTVGASHRGTSLLSAPNLFTNEYPNFYRYQIEGIAEAEPETKLQEDWFRRGSEMIQRAHQDWLKSSAPEIEFIAEPIILSGKRLLDDEQNSFQSFDRSLGVYGIPQPPTFITAH